MKAMLKKLLVTVLLFAILAANFAFFVPSTARAQGPGPWYNSSFQEFYTKVYDENTSPPQEIFGERYTAAQVQWVIYGLFALFLNTITGGNTAAITCVMNKAIGDCGGAIGEAISSLPKIVDASSNSNKALAVFSNRPISLSEYVNEVRQKLKIVPEAKAQGFGFRAANPILELWRISRDVSYTLLVLAVIAIAFMIMFRIKLSPQTIITVQSALPKIIAGIILITFSYAIAGFLIDLMYVVIGLVSTIVAGRISSFGWEEIFTSITQENNILFLFVHYWFWFFLGFVINLFTAFFAAEFGAAIISLIMIVVGFIMVIVILWFSFKTIWLLIKTYVQILLNIAFAPFQILIGMVVPGGSTTAWMRTLAANLAVYPVVSFLFILAFAFLRAGLPDGTLYTSAMAFNINVDFFAGEPWHPPLTFGTTGEHGNRILWLFTSFAVIAIIPKTAELIKSVIEKGYRFESAIGDVRTVAGSAPGVGAYVSGSLEKGHYPWPLARVMRGRTVSDKTAKRAEKVSGALRGFRDATRGRP